MTDTGRSNDSVAQRQTWKLATSRGRDEPPGEVGSPSSETIQPGNGCVVIVHPSLLPGVGNSPTISAVKSPIPACQYLRFIFAYTVSVFNLPEARLCDFTIRCKGCGQNVPAPVESMPSYWIVAECPLCGEKRRYLPSDVFRGRVAMHLIRKPPQRVSIWGR